MNHKTTSLALVTVIAAAGAILVFGESSSRATPALPFDSAPDASALDSYDAGVNSTAYDASALMTYDAKDPTVSHEAGK